MTDWEKVIKGLECCGGISSVLRCPYQGSEGCDNCRGNIYLDALSLLKAQEPQPPKHIHEEYPEHDWERNKDGSIDEFAMDGDFHNGPCCKRCHDSFCIFCEPDGYETHKPCIVDEDRCPKCGNKLFKPWNKARKITYCMDCGQAVKWK